LLTIIAVLSFDVSLISNFLPESIAKCIN